MPWLTRIQLPECRSGQQRSPIRADGAITALRRITDPYRGFALVPDAAENPSTRLFAAVFAGHAPDPIGLRRHHAYPRDKAIRCNPESTHLAARRQASKLLGSPAHTEKIKRVAGPEIRGLPVSHGQLDASENLLRFG